MISSGWRDDSFNSTVEISTKVLESAALGIPILMRPAPVQIAVFGENLPIWVESEEDFITAYTSLISDHELYKTTAKKMRQAVKRYSFSQTLRRLRVYFD
jgi:glycosyltransferase involved in cell wall biosynthesis